VATVVAYILEGIVGLPVFAGGASGLARLTRRIPTTAATMLIGEVAIYAIGLAWLSRFPLPVGVLPLITRKVR
jgi:biotin transporter BioY